MADKKTQNYQRDGLGTSTQEVVELLAAILTEVRGQVTVPPLQTAANQALEDYRELRAALSLAPREAPKNNRV